MFDLNARSRVGCTCTVDQCYRGFLTDCPMRPFLIVVSAPILQFLLGVVKRQEPVGVQAFSPKAAVEAFNERIVGGFAWSREVQGRIRRIRPKVEIA